VGGREEANTWTEDNLLHKIFSNRGDKLRQKSDQKWLRYARRDKLQQKYNNRGGKTSAQGTNLGPR
jgi:hypothetical protein